MDLLTGAWGSGRCITVWIMVDDEASGCQGQLHTDHGPQVYPCSPLQIYITHTIFTQYYFLVLLPNSRHNENLHACLIRYFYLFIFSSTTG